MLFVSTRLSKIFFSFWKQYSWFSPPTQETGGLFPGETEPESLQSLDVDTQVGESSTLTDAENAEDFTLLVRLPASSLCPPGSSLKKPACQRGKTTEQNLPAPPGCSSHDKAHSHQQSFPAASCPLTFSINGLPKNVRCWREGSRKPLRLRMARRDQKEGSSAGDSTTRLPSEKEVITCR